MAVEAARVNLSAYVVFCMKDIEKYFNNKKNRISANIPTQKFIWFKLFLFIQNLYPSSIFFSL